MKESISDQLVYLRTFANTQLNENILPFWRKYTIDTLQGGFYGRVNDDLSVDKQADKGLIMNARILWTFSVVYRENQDREDLELAHRAHSYINEYFYDKKYGGYYWALKPNGSPADEKKQIYAQAFVIYALSEYFKVTLDSKVLQKARDLFHLVEKHSFDTIKNGYIEARSREWAEMADLRLSAKDLNEKKSMNTHLHVLEAYANLYKVWKDPYLKQQLENLIRIFDSIIISKEDHHQILFFDDDWNSKSSIISFGHDIETSWLLHEAALISENAELIHRITPCCIQMAEAVKTGLSPKGALFYESDRKGDHRELEIEWWAQAEAVVGFLNAYAITQDNSYLHIAVQLARFIEQYIVDKEHGEWFFRVTEEGVPIAGLEKAGFWKCPYHNSRACLEILHRIGMLSEQ
jgi:mannobiose 2-epimerase